MNSSERKLEIFIGATKKDLAEERLKIQETILEEGHIPCGMELWSSDVDPTQNTILKRLNPCDVHIVLLGARYGAVLEEDGKRMSYTEWEYLKSLKKGRPVLAFVLDSKDVDKVRAEVIKQDPSEAKNDGLLKRFRAELLSKRFCRTFEFKKQAGVGELGRKCSAAIHRVMDSDLLAKNSGWMRADSDDLKTGRAIRENRFLDRVMTRIRQFSKLTKRVLVASESKEALAKVFWRSMIGSIREKAYSNLFFESGSTMAYVSYEFEQEVLEIDKDTARWHIRTNNVETLLQMVLLTNEDVRRLPIATPDPDDPYGAIFPPHWRKIRQDASSKPRDLFRSENEAVSDLRRIFRQNLEKPLILATTSGLDLRHSNRHFQGPHVGSHPNMLFKRAIFTLGSPVVLFLHAEKLGSPFEAGKCFPVFGPDLSWESALKKFPFAICVGYRDRQWSSFTRKELDGLSSEEANQRNDPTNIKHALEGLGLTNLYATQTVESNEGLNGAVIMANDQFRKYLPKY